MNITIQQATTKDTPTLITLWQAIDTAGGERPFGGDSADKPDHAATLLQQTLASENAAVLIAIHSTGTIIGTISGHVFNKPAVNIDRVGVIYSLWVNEEYRQQGVGQKLLTQLETRLKEKGAQAFQVGWDQGNSHAALWWQKRGYLPYEVIASKIAVTKTI
jgi:ribosomal protein S18 acetylase RimI-like enzyme